MQSLVLEGGSFRPLFSCGVMDALLEENIEFPYCIGASAGISNGTSYVSKQKGRNLEVFLKYRNDKRYIGRRNFLKNRSIFGLDFAFGKVPNELVPFDRETFIHSKTKCLIVATNTRTGKAEYFDGKDIDEDYTFLRATCALPVLFPRIKIDDETYYDGGLSDPIPIRKAIADGNKKHLIVLTRPQGYQKKVTRYDSMAAKMVGIKCPKIKQRLLTRYKMYNETVKYCEQLEKSGDAVIIRPTYNINSFESDCTKLKEAYDLGYKMAKQKMDDIKRLFVTNQPCRDDCAN